MSFSNGTFTINSTGQPVVTGTVISSTVFNAFTADLATGLSTCVLKDGTQTLTANIPMGTYILTGLGAGTANGHSVRWQQTAPGILTTTGDILYASAANTPARLAIGTARQQLATNSGATAPEWVASMQSILTTTGDTIQTTAANTPARLAASAPVAAHATTSDVWTARETILTGTAVTFTDIADAPYVGAVAWVYQNAAHIWTDGAVFDVQGGANYTATIGDWVRINAVTVSTFDVTIFKADGTAVAVSQNPSVTSIALSDGGVTTPPLLFTSDTDTGVYRVAANILGLTSGGVLGACVNSGVAIFGGKSIVSDDTIYVEATGLMTSRLATSTGKTHINFNDGATTVGSISSNTTTTFYNTSSDKRLKENIADVALDPATFDKLRPVSWTWARDKSAVPGIGFIAQELYKIAPFAVLKGDDSEKLLDDSKLWQVDLSKLVPLLVFEIQQLRKRVQALEKSI